MQCSMGRSRSKMQSMQPRIEQRPSEYVSYLNTVAWVPIAKAVLYGALAVLASASHKTVWELKLFLIKWNRLVTYWYDLLLSASVTIRSTESNFLPEQATPMCRIYKIMTILITRDWSVKQRAYKLEKMWSYSILFNPCLSRLSKPFMAFCPYEV